MNIQQQQPNSAGAVGSFGAAALNSKNKQPLQKVNSQGFDILGGGSNQQRPMTAQQTSHNFNR
jgi:hypothetical protein